MDVALRGQQWVKLRKRLKCKRKMDADRWEDGEKVERWIAKRDKGKESEEKPKSERH